MSHYRNGKNGGRVGGHVRNTFLGAVDAYLAWEAGEPEPMVDFEVRLVARPTLSPETAASSGTAPTSCPPARSTP
jgi:hypothetical protein